MSEISYDCETALDQAVAFYDRKTGDTTRFDLAALRAEVARLRGALAPFAHVAEFSEGDHRWAIKRGGDVRAITHEDLLRARAALTPEPEAGECACGTDARQSMVIRGEPFRHHPDCPRAQEVKP